MDKIFFTAEKAKNAEIKKLNQKFCILRGSKEELHG